MGNLLRRHNTEVFLLSVLIVIISSVIALISLYFDRVHKRKLWIEFFSTFTSLILVNYGYYIFLSGTDLHFLLYTSLVFVGLWILLFIFHTPKYYTGEWINEKYWRNLNAFQFEEEIAELFRGLGYKAQVTQKTVDFGVDVIVWIKGVKTAVQCKRYNGHPATCSEVRDLWGAKEYYECKGAIMVALDGVTRQGQQFIDKFENYDFMTMYDIIDNVRKVKEKEDSDGELYS